MLKQIRISAAIFFMLLLSCNDEQKMQDAYNYNQFIYSTMDPVLDKMIVFEMAAFDEDTEKLEMVLQELIHQIDVSESTIKTTEAFEGNDALKNSAIEILSFYRSVTNDEYQNIINIIIATPGAVDTEYKIHDILNDIYKKETRYYDTFEQESSKFAEKYGFKLGSTLLKFE
jgi:hypothetical protein